MAPQLGRFLSVDPENAGADTRNPQSWNAFAYVHNNPFLYIDPNGREPQVVVVTANPDPISVWSYDFSDDYYFTQFNTGAIEGYNPYMDPYVHVPGIPERIRNDLYVGVDKPLPSQLVDLFDDYPQLKGLNFDLISITKGFLGFDGARTTPDLVRPLLPYSMFPFVFTRGYTITFSADGYYDPNSIPGLKLMAEEIFHVKQYMDLGLTPFAMSYTTDMVKGFLDRKGFWDSYDNVQIEKDAKAFADQVERDLTASGFPGGW